MEFKVIMLQNAFCEHRESGTQGGYELHDGEVKGSLTDLYRNTPVSSSCSLQGNHFYVGTEVMAIAATS